MHWLHLSENMMNDLNAGGLGQNIPWNGDVPDGKMCYVVVHQYAIPVVRMSVRFGDRVALGRVGWTMNHRGHWQEFSVEGTIGADLMSYVSDNYFVVQLRGESRTRFHQAIARYDTANRMLEEGIRLHPADESTWTPSRGRFRWRDVRVSDTSGLPITNLRYYGNTTHYDPGTEEYDVISVVDGMTRRYVRLRTRGRDEQE